MSQKTKRLNIANTGKSHGHAERPNERLEPGAQIATSGQANLDEVAALAYKFWEERGRPDGSDQEDWLRAENELKSRKLLISTAAGR